MEYFQSHPNGIFALTQLIIWKKIYQNVKREKEKEKHFLGKKKVVKKKKVKFVSSEDSTTKLKRVFLTHLLI